MDTAALSVGETPTNQRNDEEGVILEHCLGGSMKRIDIKWDNEEMVGGIIEGTVTIAEGDFAVDMPTVHSFRIEVGEHSLAIRGLNHRYIPPEARDYRDIIHTMAECYYAGLINKKDLYHWVVEKE